MSDSEAERQRKLKAGRAKVKKTSALSRGKMIWPRPKIYHSRFVTEWFSMPQRVFSL